MTDIGSQLGATLLEERIAHLEAENEALYSEYQKLDRAWSEAEAENAALTEQVGELKIENEVLYSEYQKLDRAWREAEANLVVQLHQRQQLEAAHEAAAKLAEQFSAYAEDLDAHNKALNAERHDLAIETGELKSALRQAQSDLTTVTGSHDVLVEAIVAAFVQGHGA